MSLTEIKLETDIPFTDIELELLQQQIQFITTAQAKRILVLEIKQSE
jgi:hypothetical protein